MTDDTAVRPAARSLRPLRELLPFVAPYRRQIVYALVALAVAAAATLALPMALRGMIDGGFSASDADSVDRHFVTLFAVAMVMGAASALRFLAGRARHSRHPQAGVRPRRAHESRVL